MNPIIIVGIGAVLLTILIVALSKYEDYRDSLEAGE
jgi:hypothetical protein